MYDPSSYRVFPGGKMRPGRAADHSPHSSAAVMEEYSYNFTHPLGQTGPVTGSLYFYFYNNVLISFSMPQRHLVSRFRSSEERYAFPSGSLQS